MLPCREQYEWPPDDAPGSEHARNANDGAETRFESGEPDAGQRDTGPGRRCRAPGAGRISGRVRGPAGQDLGARGAVRSTVGGREILFRQGQDGNVTAYMVYDDGRLPVKRVDVDPVSASHAGIAPPHVVDYVEDVAPDGRSYRQPGDVELPLL